MVVPGFDLLGDPTMILNSTAWRKASVGEGGFHASKWKDRG
jgi:hypothetical protein